MTCNVGRKERVIRLALGAGAIPALAAARRSTPWKIALGAVAIAGILTGISRYCPMNRAFHIDRCPSV